MPAHHIPRPPRTLSHLCPKQPAPVCYVTAPGTRCFVPPPKAAPWRRLAWTVTLRVGSENTQWPWYGTLRLPQSHTAWNSKILPHRARELELRSLNIGSGVAKSIRKMNGDRFPVWHSILSCFQTDTSSYTIGNFLYVVKAFKVWGGPELFCSYFVVLCFLMFCSCFVYVYFCLY
jgi:hypothetical protein